MARLASVVGAFGTQVLLAWFLARETNGYVQKTLIVVQMAVMAGSFGLQTSLYNLLPRLAPAERKGLIGQTTALLAVLGGLLGAGVFFAAPLLAHWFRQPEIVPLLRMGALVIVASLPAMISDPVFIVEERAWFSAANAAGFAVLQLAALGALLWARLPLPWFFAVLATVSLLKVVPPLLFVTFGVPGGRWWVLNRKGVVEQLTYVLPVGITSMIDTISSWLDRTIVSVHYAASDLAVYTYGAIEIPFVAIVVGAVSPVLLPQFAKLLSENNPGAVLRLWHRATEKGAVILFGVFFFFMWLAPEFLVAAYSDKYRGSALYLRIYLLLLPVRIIAFMPLLFALNRRTYAMTGAACEVVINAIVSLALVRETSLGMAGAALGTVAATLWQVWFYLGGIGASLGVPYRSLLPWRELGRLFVKAAVFFAPLVLLKLPALRAIPDWVRFLAGCPVFALYLWYSVLPRLQTQRPPVTA